MVQPGSHRKTARVLLIDANLRVFLLLTHFDPEVQLPPRWITPGGGIDDGETVLEAAVRELFEETGISVTGEDLGEPIWQTSGRWIWGDEVNSHEFTDTFYLHQIYEPFELDQSNWTNDERRDVLDYRWWSAADLNSQTDNLIGPPGLAEFLTERLFPSLKA